MEEKELTKQDPNVVRSSTARRSQHGTQLVSATRWRILSKPGVGMSGADRLAVGSRPPTRWLDQLPEQLRQRRTGQRCRMQVQVSNPRV